MHNHRLELDGVDMNTMRHGTILAGAAGALLVGVFASAGIDRGGVTFGIASRASQIVVNGISYETAGARITIDGVPGTLEEIASGQLVTVEGPVTLETQTGTAFTVEFADNVEGPIQSLDVPAGTLTVLGQPVRVSATITYGGAAAVGAGAASASGPVFGPSPYTLARLSLESLEVGEPVEVSGLADADGAILATHIRAGLPGNLEVTGIVEDLDEADEEFSINDLLVDYSGATLIGFGTDELSEGDTVEARGLVLGPGGELLATAVIRRAAGLAGDPGDGAILEGFVTDFVSVLNFSVGGTPIRTNAETEFEDGSPADLELNVRLRIDGEFDANGRVLASEVTFLEDDDDGDAATAAAATARRWRVLMQELLGDAPRRQ
jgi:hypothetical protein